MKEEGTKLTNALSGFGCKCALGSQPGGSTGGLYFFCSVVLFSHFAAFGCLALVPGSEKENAAKSVVLGSAFPLEVNGTREVAQEPESYAFPFFVKSLSNACPSLDDGHGKYGGGRSKLFLRPGLVQCKPGGVARCLSRVFFVLCRGGGETSIVSIVYRRNIGNMGLPSMIFGWSVGHDEGTKGEVS